MSVTTQTKKQIMNMRYDVRFWCTKDKNHGIIQLLNDEEREMRCGEQHEALKALKKLATHIYNCGYEAGHHDTVEACFTSIFPQDMDSYQNDVVEELLNELGGEV